jgi:nitrogen fixation/metabolism regulation signal transduction histidine kinase
MERWLENFARTHFLRSADTAHDLKTPLNVAVLNLELLRMRLRKIAGEDDEKLAGYTRAIETELRRMGRIFDAYFLLATPPPAEGAPAPFDVTPVFADAAASSGIALDAPAVPVMLAVHEARIRQAAKLFFEGASRLLAAEERTARWDGEHGRMAITVAGRPGSPDFEVTKIFKLYYTDAEGNPDLALAVARLIIETYGGELNAVEERDKVFLRLSFPPGAQ